MSVIIKDMEVPQYCGACHVGFCKQIGCELYIGFDDYATSRHPDCPISNIPTPHGKLIDADKNTFPTPHRNPSNDYMKGWNACLHSVQQQPTVIPAEEET